MHGTKDSVIPLHHSEELVKNFKEGVLFEKLIELEGGDHNDMMHLHKQLVYKKIRTFMKVSNVESEIDDDSKSVSLSQILRDIEKKEMDINNGIGSNGISELKPNSFFRDKILNFYKEHQQNNAENKLEIELNNLQMISPELKRNLNLNINEIALSILNNNNHNMDTHIKVKTSCDDEVQINNKNTQQIIETQTNIDIPICESNKV